MLKLGAQSLSALYLGGEKITKAYQGDALVFDSAPAPSVYTVTVAIDPAGSGTVTGAGQYREGEIVTLDATATDGMAISKWRIGGVDVGTGTSYAFTVTGDVEVVAVFAKASRLPAGYTEVEYIETTNGIRFPINFTLNTSKDVIESKWMVTKINSGSDKNRIFGYPVSTGYAGLRTVTATSVERRFQATAGGSITSTVGNMLNFERNITVDYPNKQMSVGATSIAMGTIGVPTGTLNLFSNGSSSNITSNGLVGRLYYFKIKNGANLAVDLVPCINPSGQAGLYDAARQAFYVPNVNSTNLVSGPVV